MPALGDSMKSLPDGIPAAGHLMRHYPRRRPPGGFMGEAPGGQGALSCAPCPRVLQERWRMKKISVYQEDRHVALANNCGNR